MIAKSKKPTRKYNSSAAWKEIGGKRCYFRSKWEANFAEHLQTLKEMGRICDWEFEPKTFWFESIKRGVRSYKPDFQVFCLDRSHYWIEVKGYMDAMSKTKIKRFAKYYPEELLIVIDKSYFDRHGKVRVADFLITQWKTMLAAQSDFYDPARE